MNNFGLVVKGICIITAIILGFLFPARLIDAIRLADEEEARDSRGQACACFGFLVIFFILLINS